MRSCDNCFYHLTVSLTIADFWGKHQSDAATQVNAHVATRITPLLVGSKVAEYATHPSCVYEILTNDYFKYK